MKKITTLLCILFMTLTGVAQTFTVDGLDYEVISTNPDEVEITGGTVANGQLIIPETVIDNTTTYTVTKIGGEAFEGAGITSVSMPTTVTQIRGAAFQDNDLTSIVIPSSVTRIDSGAFRLNNLTDVSIPTSVSSVGNNAFRQNSLTSVTIGNNVTAIGNNAFRDNPDLVLVTSNNTAPPTLGTDVFLGTSNVKALIVPEGTVTTYQEAGWTDFSSINGPLVGSAFSTDGFTYEVTSREPNQVTVKSSTHSGDIVIPSQVTEGENGITFSVTQIGVDAFRNDTITNIVIPDGVTRIDNGAFRENNITEVLIPDSVTSIGDGSFRENNITTLSIGNNITTIGNNTFRQNQLETITIPAMVISIGGGAFADNPTALTITSLAAIPPSIVQNTSNVLGSFGVVEERDLIVPEGTAQAYLDAGWTGFNTINGGPLTVDDFSIDGFTYEVTSIEPDQVTLKSSTHSGDIIIPSQVTESESGITFSVTQIGEGAFRDTNVTSIVIPTSVTSIGNSAFRENSLTEVTIPNSVTSIGNGVFRQNSLTSVTIGNTVTSIGNNAFRANPDLVLVTSNNTTPSTLGTDVFAETSNLITLSVPTGTVTAYEAAGWDTNFLTVNGGELNATVSFALAGTTYEVTTRGLESNTVKITNNTSSGDIIILSQIEQEGVTFTITEIGDDAFRDDGITSVVFPETMTKIGNDAFRANNLTSVVLGPNITFLGSTCFSDNVNLISVVSMAIEPPTFVGFVFSLADSLIRLTVPPESEDAYRNDDRWRGAFFTINGQLTQTGKIFSINGFNYRLTSIAPNELEIIGNTNSGDVSIPPTVTANDNILTITSIASNAFEEDGLTSITIPDGVTSIGDEAFMVNNITELTIPNNVTSIGDEAFMANNITELTIPNNVTSIGIRAFGDNRLTHLTIGSKVSSIGSVAFINNTDLTSVTSLNTTAPVLGFNVFFNSPSETNSKTLTVPEGTELDYLEAGWTGFTSINDAPASTTFTVNGFSYEITSLEPNRVTLTASTGSGAITIPSEVVESQSGFTFSIKEIGNGAFEGNNVTAITIPNGVTSIGGDAFRDNSLTEVSIPITVTSIRSGAFRENSLTEVTIPNSVTFIGSGVFRDNPALASVTVQKEVPPSLVDNAFTNTSDDIILTVPAGTELDYLEAGWTGFASINGMVLNLNFEVDNLRYQITSLTPNTVVLKRNVTAVEDVTIPETVSNGSNTYSVTTIKDEAFLDASLNSVVIGNNIHTIGIGAFRGNNFTAVSIPDNVVSIGSNAFRDNSLINIIIGSNVSSINTDAFSNNPALVSVISNNPTPPILETNVFNGAPDSITLTVPEGKEVDYFFSGWNFFASINGTDSGLTFIVDQISYTVTSINPNTVTLTDGTNRTGDVTLPDTVSNGVEDYTVNRIGNAAFLGSNLTSVTIPTTVTHIGTNAFRENSLTDVSIPISVTSIGNGAFRENSLTDISILTSVTSIGVNAFRDNLELVSVTSNNTIPPPLGTDAFANTSDIITLTIPEGTEAVYKEAGWTDFFRINGVLQTGHRFTVDGFRYETISVAPNEVKITGSTQAGDIVLPASVIINTADFSVTVIGEDAFRFEDLTSVVIPNTITHIEAGAFGDSGSLGDVVIPDSVVSIGMSAFTRCGITSVVLSNNLVSIGNGAFRENSLTSVVIPDSVTSIDIGGFSNNNLTNVILSNNLTHLGTGAFSSNNLTSIVLPESLTSINNSVFSSNNLVSVTIPNTITSIGDFAFGNNNLTEITIPNSITSIGNDAFKRNSIESIAIPDGVTSIGDFAFSDNNLTSIDLPDSVTSIGKFAFFLNNLEAVDMSVTIPRDITIINDGTFVGLYLTQVSIPEGVTSIGSSAFAFNNFTHVTIPSSVTSIDRSAFSENPNLVSAISKNTTPPALGIDVFKNTNSDKTLYVPTGSVQAYINSSWADFFTTITEIPLDITVALKVFLQGASLNPIAGEENLMRDSLRENGLLPTISPYGDGATVDPTVFDTTGADAIVDWVLVELRTGADNENTTVVNSTSAFLQRDGDVVDVDGVSTITFTEEEGDYFIAIRHRNHIGVLAAVPVALSNTATALDFTQDITAAKGENLALTTLVNGTFAMIAGDADGSSQILNTDITEALGLAGGGQAYATADADMNGFVLNSDIQLLVLANSGTVQQFD